MEKALNIGDISLRFLGNTVPTYGYSDISLNKTVVDIYCESMTDSDTHTVNGITQNAFAHISINGNKPVTVSRYNKTEQRLFLSSMLLEGKPLPLETVLAYMPLTLLLAYNSTAVIHSSCVIMNGKSIIFAAASGSGKSTQAGFWKERFSAEILNDDRTVLSFNDGHFKSYGCYYDNIGKTKTTKFAEAAAIVIPVKSDKNRAERLTIKQGFVEIINNMMKFPDDNKVYPMFCDLALEAAKNVSVYRLLCTCDSASAEVLHDKLTTDGVL